jgi:hypothetical protein
MHRTLPEGRLKCQRAVDPHNHLTSRHLTEIRFAPAFHLVSVRRSGEVFLTSGRAGFARDFWGDLGVRRHLE